MDGPGSKSKKPSGASSGQKQPDPPIFFLDRSLGRNRIAIALRESGITVHVHDDHFPANAKDEEWLTQVGKWGWVVLTKDRRIRYRNVERMALMKAGVAAFILTSGDLHGKEMAQIFVEALPRIHRYLKKQKRPFIASVSRSSSISLLFK